ncbi:MAG: hypothetical protein D6690_05630 [Nitrospirae bacterium]|nr:MAG: hypothetical protein D6690_05630 [Nitrospirota bacterium]
MMPSSVMLASAFDVSEAFHIMCKIAVDAGLSRREMESAVDAAWHMRSQLETMPLPDLIEATVGAEVHP